MYRVLGYRAVVFTLGALIGLGLPALVLGPFVIQNLSLSEASPRDIAVAGILLLLGVWLIVLSFFAEGSIIEVVIGTFEAEALLLMVPYLLYVMSRSVFRRVFGRRGHGAL
jgi:hypothetical protein